MCVPACTQADVCVGVLMWWCSLIVEKPVVPVIASVSLTASLSTQELLSHAGCFCQSWAEDASPQRFFFFPPSVCVLVLRSVVLLSTCTCIYFPCRADCPLLAVESRTRLKIMKHDKRWRWWSRHSWLHNYEIQICSLLTINNPLLINAFLIIEVIAFMYVECGLLWISTSP